MIRKFKKGFSISSGERYFGLMAALILLVAIFSFTTEHFFSLATFSTIANQIPDLVIMSVGMTFVLMIAGIDLSVGSVMALSGAILGVGLINLNIPVWISIPLCILTGLVCGLINGLVVVRWNLPSFIVTLGMMEVARGLSYLTTNSLTVYVDKLDFMIDPIIKWTKDGEVVNPCPWLTVPFILAIIVVLFANFILTRTVFGRYVIAVGTNQEATRLSGINPNPIKITVFAISGLLAGLAAVIHTARYQANPNNGDGMELLVIAAVVIGGTSLMGGRGSVICTLFGVLIIKVLEAGLSQVGAGVPAKQIITGMVIVIAVILDYYRNKVSKKSSG